MLRIRFTFMRIRILLVTFMRIRIQFFTLMRIRILPFNLMRIHPDPDPQHCVPLPRSDNVSKINEIAKLRYQERSNTTHLFYLLHSCPLKKIRKNTKTTKTTLYYRNEREVCDDLVEDDERVPDLDIILALQAHHQRLRNL